MICPQCKGDLELVRQSEPRMLNSDQFDAVKAGDYFCKTCKSKKAHTGYKYFWAHEI